MFYFSINVHMLNFAEWGCTVDPPGETGEGVDCSGDARQPEAGHGHQVQHQRVLRQIV